MDKMSLSQMYKNNFHEMTRFLLFLLNCVGLFPVSGLGNKNSRDLRFTCKSIFFFLSFITLTGQFLNALNSVIYVLIHKPNGGYLYDAAIHVLALFSLYHLIKLARSWPKLVLQIENYEAALPLMSFRRIFKTRYIFPIILTLSILFIFFAKTAFYLLIAKLCKEKEQYNVLDSFLYYNVPGISDILPHGAWRFWLILVIHLQKTLALNTIDILIIMICMYLINCYQEFNLFVDRYKEMHPPVWNVIRMHHTRLSSLVKLMDKAIGSFILLSFTHNLLIICVTVFRILKNDLAHNLQPCPIEHIDEISNSIQRSTYLISSLVLTTIRLLAVGNLAAKVQVEAKKCVFVLNNLQTCCYDVHAKRFLEEIHAYTPCLSGLNFFQVSQGAILSMFAAIVTFELVLIQFSTIL